jgi:N-methylhydantoinase B
MPADHETIRIWGIHGGTIGKDFFLFREVLGGGGPGRPWADGSDVVHVVPNFRNLPAEFSETRYPVIIEKLGPAVDSSGAGYRRGGFGYDKQVRVLEECEALSNADRSLMHTYGVNGGKYGGTYGVDIAYPDGEERRLAGMEERVPVMLNSTIKIRTTGGAWGDPLAREADTTFNAVWYPNRPLVTTMALFLPARDGAT